MYKKVYRAGERVCRLVVLPDLNVMYAVLP